MDRRAAREIIFAIHSADALTDALDKGVSAKVFALKLASVVRALEAATRAVNGFDAYAYTLSSLHMSTPTAVLREEYVSVDSWEQNPSSGVSALEQCADAVAMGDKEGVRRFGACAKELKKLTHGASKKFGYAELQTSPDNVIRIDEFLRERVGAVQGVEPKAEPSESWFKGAVFGSFVGSVLEADLRGSLPEIKLVLSAGGKEIGCVCNGSDIEMIRGALNKRVRIVGRAIYDGRSGLPRRVQVRTIETMGEAGDFMEWRGSFAPFEPIPWNGEFS